MPDRGGGAPPERPRGPGPRVVFGEDGPARGATGRAPEGRPPRRPVDPLRRLRGEDVAPRPDTAAAPRPAVRSGEADRPAPTPDRPRVVAGGQVRRRLPCTPLDLWVLDPLAPDPIVGAALRVVEGLNLDEDPADAVARFGRALQEEHARLGEEALAQARGATADEARALIGRLLDLLRGLDPDAVLGIPGPGILGALMALAEPPPDPRAVFHARHPDLRAAAASLEGVGRRLAAEAECLRVLGERLDGLDRRIHAHVLAARFVVDRVRATPDDGRLGPLVDALEAKVRGLSAARGSLDAGRRALAASRDRSSALVAAIGRMADEDLPAWRTAYAAALLPASPRDAGRRAALDGLRAAHARITTNLEAERAA